MAPQRVSSQQNLRVSRYRSCMGHYTHLEVKHTSDLTSPDIVNFKKKCMQPRLSCKSLPPLLAHTHFLWMLSIKVTQLLSIWRTKTKMVIPNNSPTPFLRDNNAKPIAQSVCNRSVINSKTPVCREALSTLVSLF